MGHHHTFGKKLRHSFRLGKKSIHSAQRFGKKLNRGVSTGLRKADTIARKTQHTLEKASPYLQVAGGIAGGLVGDPMLGTQVADGINNSISAIKRGRQGIKTAQQKKKQFNTATRNSGF